MTILINKAHGGGAFLRSFEIINGKPAIELSSKPTEFTPPEAETARQQMAAAFPNYSVELI